MKTAELFQVNIDPPVTLQAGIEYECVIRERRQWLPKPTAPGWWWRATKIGEQWQIDTVELTSRHLKYADEIRDYIRWQPIPTPQPPEAT